MYEYLEGEVAGRTPARLVLDVSGVGYDLCVPLSAAFPERGRARAWTHLVVREDAHTLYGFPEKSTRDLFRVLLGVRGVGPVAALAILSGLSAADLVAAVANEDLKALTRVKGIGKKTGEQILLDLRDKAPRLASEIGAKSGPAGTPGAKPAARDLHVEDAVAALVSIGYSDKEARKAVEAAIERAAATNGARDLATLVRSALAG
ncbi:MAG: Holliday junction branch migration protein RuvA [Planctomycetota bacterium]|nr:Holliday junction branch migration protein RuvA [Planctomycetota bacterium]